MFGSDGAVGGVEDLALLTSDQLADRVVANHRAALAAETQLLRLACAWVDVHDRDPDEAGFQPLVERSCFWGGEGTPAVSEFCVIEFGTLQQLSAGAAQAVITDALDLRHRLPRLWELVCAGSVRGWQARKVAQETRRLSKKAAAEVDTALSDHLAGLPWGRFQRLLLAAIIDADPSLAEERAGRVRRERDVFSCEGPEGLQTIIARAVAGDAIWFMATVNRLADILAAEGDADPVTVLRSKAIGLLAQPARALQLLIEHQHDLARPEHAEPDGEAEPDSEAEAVPDAVPATEPDAEPDPHRSLDLTAPVGRLDPAVGRPRVVLHFHLAEDAIGAGHGVVRPEHGEPLSLAQLREFLADTGCAVTVLPVFDPGQVPPVDGYEISARMRAAVRRRQVVEVFPYGTCSSRSMDLDHSRPYLAPDNGGPPGQTRVDNLGPLSRRAHRAVTHGGWQRRQPAPGQYVYRSPHGFLHLVTNQGTVDLGRTDFATRVWLAADDPQ